MKKVKVGKALVRIHDHAHERHGEKDVMWVVVKEGEIATIEVEDDVKAPLGWVWDGDYKTGRPEFFKAGVIEHGYGLSGRKRK